MLVVAAPPLAGVVPVCDDLPTNQDPQIGAAQQLLVVDGAPLSVVFATHCGSQASLWLVLVA